MATSPDLALILAYLARYNRLRLHAGATVGQLWDRYAQLDDDIVFPQHAAGLSRAAQTVTATAVAGYLAALFRVMHQPPLRPTVGPVTIRNGTPTVDVYRRGIVAARTAIANGRTLEQAMAIGRDRMTSAASMDVALAQQSATTDVLRPVSGVVGYSRVLTGESCALCGEASTQRYRVADLMPIHNNCDCGVAPIFGDRDPGQVINRPLVDNLKAARGQGAVDRHMTVGEDGTVHFPPVAVREHGELGPVLTRAGDRFTSEDDISA